MKAFIYQGRTYIRCIPGKSLFHSTMIHEVVNRGDVFGLDVDTQRLTIIPGRAKVDHLELTDWKLAEIAPLPEVSDSPAKLAALAKLRFLRDKANARLKQMDLSL